MAQHPKHEQKLNKYLQQFIDDDPSIRRRGLQEMTKYILEVPTGLRLSFTVSHLISPLIAGLSDPIETCRSLSLTLVANFVSECSAHELETFGCQIVCTTSTRFGSRPFKESVEELRLRHCLDMDALSRIWCLIGNWKCASRYWLARPGS
mmetsp:Transcript_4305/g.13525  ORF Transcript_4305/g.13525 Transcript_4305/m.13525 type:complete len:150 (-) Transcript_4305:2835-3284(-)